MKTAAKGGAELNVEEVFKPIRINKVKQMICIELKKKKVLCATTENFINGQIRKSKLNCPVQLSRCSKCQCMGHFGKTDIRKINEDRERANDEMKVLKIKYTMTEYIQ